jgi:hypothetical protein
MYQEALAMCTVVKYCYMEEEDFLRRKRDPIAV